MLLSDAKESFKLSRISPVADADDAMFEALFGEMEREGRERMRGAGFDDADITYARAVEMRYSGQEFTLRLPFSVGESDVFGDLHKRFAQLHALRYGHAFESMPSEIVDLIVEVYGHLPKPVVKLAPSTEPSVSAPSRRVYFEDEGFIECRVCRRDALAPGAHVEGPLIVEEATSTTLIHPGDSVTVDAESNLVITVGTSDGISRAASRRAQPEHDGWRTNSAFHYAQRVASRARRRWAAAVLP